MGKTMSIFLRLIILPMVLGVCVVEPALARCDDGHWVESVINDGSIVKLEDGSIWSVDPTSQLETALWLPLTNVTACEDKLINVDDNEVATATQVR
jgi:hypothetical protein